MPRTSTPKSGPSAINSPQSFTARQHASCLRHPQPNGQGTSDSGLGGFMQVSMTTLRTHSRPRSSAVLKNAYRLRSSPEVRIGREHGAKDRPCGVILTRITKAGTTVASVLPITHTPPLKDEDGIDACRTISTGLFLSPIPDGSHPTPRSPVCRPRSTPSFCPWSNSNSTIGPCRASAH